MKYNKIHLKRILDHYAHIVLCLSGGIDSCTLLMEVQSLMQNRVEALTFKSPFQHIRQINTAIYWARSVGVSHRLIDYHPLEVEGIRKNSKKRCYLCKTRMFSFAYGLMEERSKNFVIIDGTNSDDNPSNRPGMRANHEFGIVSPWEIMGMGKGDIWEMAQERGITALEWPPDSCLATRFPFDYPLNANELKRLECAEEVLKALGFTDFRLRPADSPPRLLLSANDFQRARGLGSNRIEAIVRDKTGLDVKGLFLSER